MEFKIFSDAYSHNRRSKEHVINLIKTRVDSTPEFALFLGAGASVSSGVKSAQAMISEWRQRLYASYKGKGQFTSWLEAQDWYDIEDQYSRLFELVYDQPSQRRAYIEKATKGAKPAWGYAFLASLLKNGIFNVIFTTNFDDLISDACYRFANDLSPMICAHDSGVSSVRLMSDRPKVVKLHGDFLYDSIKNTSSELQSLEANMREKFIEFAKEYGLIVVGYSGNDHSIMDLLDLLIRSENYFRNGLYWCIQTSSSPSKRLRQLLRNDRTYWVEIDGFDEFIAELSKATNIDLPAGILSPHKTAIDRTKHLLKPKQEFKSSFLSQASSDLSEIYDKVQNALSEVGLSDWEILERTPDTMIGELRDHAIPYVECMSLIDNKNHKEAAIKLKGLLNTSLKWSKAAWRLLMECLLCEASSHEEAKEMLLNPPPISWQSSTHFLIRSYFCLYLNMGDEALDFANRSLELNPKLAPAIVNKAIALFMKKDKEKLKREIRELISGNYGEHYKAAAYALEGDFEQTITFLQRAIVLGRYTFSDVCKDVAFRVYWNIPEFLEKLKPFFQKSDTDFPYLQSCPMSDAEQELHKKIIDKLEK